MSGGRPKGAAPVVDLVAVRRGLAGMRGARSVLRSVTPDRREAFAVWAGGETGRVRLRMRVLAALESTCGAWPEWLDLDDDGRCVLAGRAADLLDAYRTFRGLPPLEWLDDDGAVSLWLPEAGRVLTARFGDWRSWTQLDDDGRRVLAACFVAALARGE